MGPNTLADSGLIILMFFISIPLALAFGLLSFIGISPILKPIGVLITFFDESLFKLVVLATFWPDFDRCG